MVVSEWDICKSEQVLISFDKSYIFIAYVICFVPLL